MRRVRVPLAVMLAIGASLVCPTLAGEKPEQIIYQGKPITLGATVEATEWLSIRDVKFRLGTFTADGKPALAASGVLDSHWDTQAPVRVTIRAYALREDVRPRTLMLFALVVGTIDVIGSGKPTKFYAAGEVKPPDPGLKKPKSPAVLYYTSGIGVDTGNRVGRGGSTGPGQNVGEFVHENRPIALGAWVEPKERDQMAVRDLSFRMGQLLDGKPAIIVTGQVEAQSPVKQEVGINVQVYVPNENGDPDRPVVRYAIARGSVEIVGTAKPAKFQAVGFVRDDGLNMPFPKKVYYCIGFPRE